MKGLQTFQCLCQGNGPVIIQSMERVETLKGELRKEHAEKEDQLRERLVEKDAHIMSHCKQISDLQRQLEVANSIQCPFQLL